MSERYTHRTRHQVELPGGKKIEVVYLDGRDSETPVAPMPWAGDTPSTAPGEALHVCPHCAGGLVHPLDWIEESPARWRVTLRCPDCGELREGVFGQALIERLDDELDRATAEMLGDLRQIANANMAEEIERFVQALELDLIGPADF
jgi:hypothetical protein